MCVCVFCVCVCVLCVCFVCVCVCVDGVVCWRSLVGLDGGVLPAARCGGPAEMLDSSARVAGRGEMQRSQSQSKPFLFLSCSPPPPYIG